MRIQMLINVTNASGSYQRGQVVELAEPEAWALVSRGRAVLLDGEVVLHSRGRAAEPAAVSVEIEGEPAGGIESAALAGPEETTAESKPRRKRKA